MKTVQSAHPPHNHNSFLVTCRLWIASGGVHALLVLKPMSPGSTTPKKSTSMFFVSPSKSPYLKENPTDVNGFLFHIGNNETSRNKNQ